MKILTGTGKNNSRQRKNIYPTSFCLVPTALQQKWSSQSCFSALVKNPFNVADKSLNISLFRVTMGASNLLMCFVYIERKKEWLRERERKRENKKTEERKRIIKKERGRKHLTWVYCLASTVSKDSVGPQTKVNNSSHSTREEKRE